MSGQGFYSVDGVKTVNIARQGSKPAYHYCEIQNNWDSTEIPSEKKENCSGGNIGEFQMKHLFICGDGAIPGNIVNYKMHNFEHRFHWQLIPRRKR